MVTGRASANGPIQPSVKFLFWRQKDVAWRTRVAVLVDSARAHAIMGRMLFHELESKTVAELLDAFDGPPLDGEEYRVSFYDDIAQRIAELGGIEQLRGTLDTDDDDRLAAVLGAFSATQAASVDRAERQEWFRRFLTHHCPSVVASAIDGLRLVDDRDVKDQVLELIRTGPPIVRWSGFTYLRVLFVEEATPILVAALDDPDSTVRFAAVDELDDLEGFSDRTAFERMLDDPDPDISEHARYILDHHFNSS
jgi:hypothetical protein